MELKDTVELMNSSNYKDRFKAEHEQLRIRAFKLKNMLDNWDSLGFTPSCPKELLQEQLDAMAKYKTILVNRARIENINL